MEQKLVYIDTDISLGTPGAEIDDGAALMLLVRNKGIKVIGTSSVFGNVPVKDAAANLDRMMTFLGTGDIPQGLGSAQPLIQDQGWFEEWQAGYEPTLPWQTRPYSNLAANLLINVIRENPGNVTVLSIGPMTNLALAARMDPGIIPLTREVIVMGGSFNVENSLPEFNTHCDPEAASIVFSSGWNMTALGLDITRRVHFSRQDFESLSREDPCTALLRTQAPGWINRMEIMGWDQGGCALHDAVAAAYLVEPDLFSGTFTGVDVELTDSSLRGLTRFSMDHKQNRQVQIITEINTSACKDLIWSHLKK
jgi:inosine-uridine nucleoside N-ribohydrolase